MSGNTSGIVQRIGKILALLKRLQDFAEKRTYHGTRLLDVQCLYRFSEIETSFK